MANLRSVSKKVLLLAIFLMMSATFAMADSLTLTSGPATLENGSGPTGMKISAANFSNLSVSVLLDEATVQLGSMGTAGGFDILGTFSIDNGSSITPYNLFWPSSTKDLTFFQVGTSTTFLQNPGGPSTNPTLDGTAFVFLTDGPTTANLVYITNSELVLTSDFAHVLSWTIHGHVGSQGSTWTFYEDTADLGHNNANMVFSEAVPEPSSIYLLAMGLGLGAEAFRRARRTR